MKLTIFVLSIVVLFVTISFGRSWQDLYDQTNKSSDRNFYDVQMWAKGYFSEIEEEFNTRLARGERVHESEDERIGDYIRYKRWEWFWSTRLNSDGTLGAFDLKELARARSLPQAETKAFWKCIAHTENSGGYWGMGRIDAIGFHPTNRDIYYAGSVGGGIWKTEDGGKSYENVGSNLPLGHVGHILVDHKTPNIVYVSQGPRGGSYAHNMGVYKSTDGAQSFAPTALSSTYADGKSIFDMVMSPADAKIILAARKDGIYRTKDGGVSWNKVEDGTFNDLAWRPGDQSVVYGTLDAGPKEIFKSEDAGATWSQLTNIGGSKRLKICVTPADPDMLVYTNSDKAFYVSTDNGNSFTKKANCPSNWWIGLSPANPDIMYCAGVDVYKSTNGGGSWKQISLWHSGGSYPEVHADTRFIDYSPVEAGVVYFGNDGGVTKYSESNSRWTELDDGLVITQYYRISCAQTDPSIVQGGTQDNGGNRRRSNGSWYNTNGGDAMEQAIDPTDADVMYTTYCSGQFYRSDDGWNRDTYKEKGPKSNGSFVRGAWVTPYDIDPNDNRTLVAGYKDVWRTTNRADSWTKIGSNVAGGNSISDLEIAASDSKIIYCSRGNKLYKTINQGSNWLDYTLPGSESITRIAVSPTNADMVWVTRGGWKDGAKVFVSSNGGASWTNITGSLPNIPTNCIVYETGSNDALYVGTDYGVFYRNALMNDWMDYNRGLPKTICNDFDIHYGTKMLRVGTYGRGIWEMPLYDPSNIKSPMHLSVKLAVTKVIIYSLNGRKISTIRAKNKIAINKKLRAHPLAEGAYIVKYFSADKGSYAAMILRK